MKRNPLNREQHDALGAELYELRRRTLALSGCLARRYGTSRPVGKAAEKLQQAIDRLRCVLDDQAAVDLGAAFDTTLYYRAHLPTTGAKA